jgi:hypothetical protein
MPMRLQQTIKAHKRTQGSKLSPRTSQTSKKIGGGLLMPKYQWDKPLLNNLAKESNVPPAELKKDIIAVTEALGYTDLLKIPIVAELRLIEC